MDAKLTFETANLYSYISSCIARHNSKQMCYPSLTPQLSIVSADVNVTRYIKDSLLLFRVTWVAESVESLIPKSIYMLKNHLLLELKHSSFTTKIESKWLLNPCNGLIWSKVHIMYLKDFDLVIVATWWIWSFYQIRVQLIMLPICFHVMA